VPDTAEQREDFDGWGAGAVRAGVEAIAGATDEDSEELLEVATDAARRSVIGKQQAAEQVERDLERMSRERLLPDEKTLEKVARYEAHLSRLLFKALHELEALQVRRSGGAAPLRGWTWTDWRATEDGPSPLARKLDPPRSDFRFTVFSDGRMFGWLGARVRYSTL
jgi:hypothetical protein